MKRVASLLLALILCSIFSTACSPRQIARTEYLTAPVPELPAEPEYWPVIWIRIDGGLCIDDGNAKNLVKNVAILRAHRDELLGILRDLKQAGDGHNRPGPKQ